VFLKLIVVFFFCETQLHADVYIHERTLTPMNARTYTLPLWAPTKNRIGPANLEFDKVTTGASLSTDTSPTTERNSAVKSCNKSRKIRAPVSSRRLTRVGRFHRKESNQLSLAPVFERYIVEGLLIIYIYIYYYIKSTLLPLSWNTKFWRFKLYLKL